MTPLSPALPDPSGHWSGTAVGATPARPLPEDGPPRAARGGGPPPPLPAGPARAAAPAPAGSVVVVGSGIVGLCTAWSLTKRGSAVTLLEREATIPNPVAASGDEHRIIRRAYVDPGYARTVTEAYAAWDELWADLGRSHLADRGTLVLSQRAGDGGDAMRETLDRGGHAYAVLTPAQAAAAHPFLDPAGFRYALRTEGGVLLSQRIAADLKSWLDRHGASVRTGVAVVGVDADRGRVTTAAGETIDADRVVVAIGAWTGRLFPQLADAFRTWRTSVAYLAPPADLRQAWSVAPTILSRGPVDGYVLPPVDGTGLKVGASFNKRPSDPDRGRAEEPGEGERLRAAFAPPFARIDEYAVVRVATCVLTFTADDRFLGRAVGRTAIVVSACSGHGYKFGAAIGRRVADAVETGDVDRLRRWLRAEPDDPAPAAGSPLA